MNKFALLLAPVLLALASPSAAAVVYDNGAPIGNNGNDATAWVQAEDFSFAQATGVGGAGVYLAGFDGIGNYDNAFQYYIFADAGGAPGATLASGSVSPTITDTGAPWSFGGNTFLFTFNLSSTFNAAAGVTYYFGIHASGAGDFNRDDIYWVNTAPNNTLSGRESANGTFDNWFDNGVEHAFFLTDGTVVPEPATWMLMIGGFGIVGAMARRRRGAAVAA